MKVILSRKGFDSSYGGYPSIILPSGKMISFPIPEANPNCEITEAKNLFYTLDAGRRLSLEDIFYQLKIIDKINIPEFSQSREKVPCRKGMKWEFKGEKHRTVFHYDPQIQDVLQKISDSNEIQNNYAAFGQSGAAASHLLNYKKGIREGIQKDDVFLFFGTFKYVNKELTSYGDEFHALWGYMIVDEIFYIKENGNIRIKENNDFKPVSDDDLKKMGYNNLAEHPHLKNIKTNYVEKKNNIIICSQPGRFGTFEFNTNKHRLTTTTPNKTKSWWRFNHPCLNNKKITYHNNKISISEDFKSASIGQEFMIKEEFKLDDVIDWLKDLGVNGLR